MENWFKQGNGQYANIAVAANEDGRLEIFTYDASYQFGTAGTILHKWQAAPSAGPWSDWATFPAVVNQYTYFNYFFAGHTDLFPGINDAARSLLRVVTTGGWSIAQQVTNGVWGAWKELHSGAPPDALMVSAVARSSDGRLYVFGIDLKSSPPNKVVYSNSNAAGTSWSDYQDLGVLGKNDVAWAVRVNDWKFRSGFARVNAPISPYQTIGSGKDGLIDLFACSQRGMWHRKQASGTGDNWSTGWTPVGIKPPNFGLFSPEEDWALAENDDERLEVFALRASPNQSNLFELWHTSQGAPNGPWAGKWTRMIGLPKQPELLIRPLQLNAMLTRKGAFRTARSNDGRLMIFFIGENGDLNYIMQKQDVDRNGRRDWEKHWHSLGGSGITAFDVGQNSNGTLEVFIVSNGSVYHRWQDVNALPAQTTWSTITA